MSSFVASRRFTPRETRWRKKLGLIDPAMLGPNAQYGGPVESRLARVEAQLTMTQQELTQLQALVAQGRGQQDALLKYLKVMLEQTLAHPAGWVCKKTGKK